MGAGHWEKEPLLAISHGLRATWYSAEAPSSHEKKKRNSLQAVSTQAEWKESWTKPSCPISFYRAYGTVSADHTDTCPGVLLPYSALKSWRGIFLGIKY